MLRILWNINMHGFILGQRYCFFLRCANLATKKEVLKTSSFSCCQTRTRTQTHGTYLFFLIKTIDFQRLMAFGFLGLFGSCYNFVSILSNYLLFLAQNYPLGLFVPSGLYENTSNRGSFWWYSWTQTLTFWSRQNWRQNHAPAQIGADESYHGGGHWLPLLVWSEPLVNESASPSSLWCARYPCGDYSVRTGHLLILPGSRLPSLPTQQLDWFPPWWGVLPCDGDRRKRTLPNRINTVMTSQFNAFVSGKLLVCVDETALGDNQKITEYVKMMSTAKKATMLCCKLLIINYL